MQRDVVELRADGRQRVRRGYAEAYKRRLVAATLVPGASVSRIARQHGLNTNLLFTWRRQLGAIRTLVAARVARSTPALLPVTIEPQRVEVGADAPAPASREPSNGCIEIEIGAGRVRLHGVVDVPLVEAVLRMLECGR